ncbi:MAG: hypothetical protein RRC34_00580 [Lentisphaeria bacterium]|nr:hypothetical protein [Lentisphaeria bacterium]
MSTPVFPPLDQSFKSAQASFNGTSLTITSGKTTRRWTWTGRGFLTTQVSDDTGMVWTLDQRGDRDADWLLPVCFDANPSAVPVSMEANVSNDEGFTSDHLAVTAEMTYPTAKLSLRFTVWAYPDAPGLRTSLHIRALDGFSWDPHIGNRERSQKAREIAFMDRGYQRHDVLPLEVDRVNRRLIGYYSDTQNRNDPGLNLLLERVEKHPLTHPRICEWANAVCLETDSRGIALLKESHACINTKGADTGVFALLPDHGLESHGWGIKPGDIDEQWRPAWATWCLVYAADTLSRQRAFKQFDRLRYPLTSRDIYIQANTWGSSQTFLEHREAAGEANVLNEIDSCADLGIDVLQIDDGWQGNDYSQWSPCPERYPEGWKNVRRKAAEKHVDLGLWMAAVPPSEEDILRNVKEGNFRSFKLDFAVLKNRKEIDALMGKVRSVIKQCNHELRVNWDLTEVCPRYGYYFAREFGCVYLENRKAAWPRSVTYRPGVVLKDLWEVAHYCNLLKFQGSIQNIDMTDPTYSDAAAYNHAYCVAITLMSSPLFFCETHFYTRAARDEIRPILKAYKSAREELFTGIIFPIGDHPDGTSWSGFDCQLPGGDGFLTLFREPWNEETAHRFHLPQLAGKTIIIDDLLRKTSRGVEVGTAGTIEFQLSAPADFLFLRYRESR